MTEKDAIAKAVQHYIDGAKSGSSAEMSRAFHTDATIFGYEGDSLFAGPIQRLFDWHEIWRSDCVARSPGRKVAHVRAIEMQKPRGVPPAH